MEKQLNMLLSDYVVMYHKLQNFHWNVKGKDFFQAHSKLEELYDHFKVAVDDVAEVMLMEGLQPVGTLSEFKQLATIAENSSVTITSLEVFNTVLADFKYLLQQVLRIKTEADTKNAYNISILMDDYIKNFSKTIWMLQQVMA